MVQEFIPSEKELTEDESQLHDVRGSYDEKYGFHVAENYNFKSEKGLTEEMVRTISKMKNEPQWMTDLRVEAYNIFEEKPIPKWGGGGLLDTIDFADIYYFVRATDGQGRDWDDIPAEIKDTFDRLGIPEAEAKFLQGVSAQYESEVVYHSIRKDLEDKGVMFMDMDTAMREHPDIVKEYFGTIIPSNDNKFSALNTAVWSGGSLDRKSVV